MSSKFGRSFIGSAAAALLAASVLVAGGTSAHAASEGQYASAWSSPAPTLWFPLPPGSSNPLGPSEAVTQCVGTNSQPGGAEATFSFTGFTIPATDIITGIEIKPKYLTNDNHFIQLTDNGSLIGAQQTLPLFFPGSSVCDNTAFGSIGGPANLLGTAGLTPTNFNDGDIGVRIKLSLGGIDNGSIPLTLDAIELVVHHVSGVNTPPVANPGGTYTVPEGGTVGLDGTGSSDDDGNPLTYAWDLDNDGTFETTGATPTFSAAGRNGPDSQTIALKVNDGTVDSPVVTTTVSITDVAPTITLTSVSPTSVSEGGSVDVSGEFEDPALALETYTVTAQWSDGPTTPVTVGVGTFSTSRSFPDDHPATATPSDVFTVEFTVEDNATGADDSSTAFPVTVNNVPPGLFFTSSAISIDEGDTVTLDGQFLDPALGVPTETFTGSGLWSDGAIGTVALGTGTFTSSRTFVDDDPTNTPADTFTLDVTITDDDTGANFATSPLVTVNNVDPVIDTLDVTSMIDENGTVFLTGSFSDVGIADTHEVSVDWGDGSAEMATVAQGAGGGTFAADHQYLDDDPTNTDQDIYTITVTVTDDDTGSDTEVRQTLVKNVDPVIDSIASDATFADKAEEGEPVTVSGTFSDIGTLDTHVGTIDWGDGTVTPANIVEAGGSGSFDGTHAYATGGVFTVTVTITDDDTGATSDTTLAVVTGVGINGGVLQIVGTAGDDNVHVKAIQDEIDVASSFTSPKHRRYDLAAVTSIEMWLCGGDDHGNVHQSIDLDATIHGDDGDDMLWGGSGNDLIEGGDGNDKLWGRDGDDVLDGGAGNNMLKGGKGSNTLL